MKYSIASSRKGRRGDFLWRWDGSMFEMGSASGPAPERFCFDDKSKALAEMEFIASHHQGDEFYLKEVAA
jgi:hypothetical protein